MVQGAGNQLFHTVQGYARLPLMLDDDGPAIALQSVQFIVIVFVIDYRNATHQPGHHGQRKHHPVEAKNHRQATVRIHLNL